MVDVVTKAEAARRWGVSPQAVTKYQAKGMPVRPDGRLDWLVVKQWREEFNVPEKSGSFRSRTDHEAPVSESAGAEDLIVEDFINLHQAEIPGFETEEVRPESSLAEATRDLQKARAKREQIRLAREEGALVELAPVNAFVAGMIVKARDLLLRIPTEVRDRLAQETDPIRIEELLSAKVNAALSEMALYQA